MDHKKATTVLILGILGLTVCAFCAPAAWLMGNSYVQSCRSAGVQPESSGTTGRLLGIIGTVLLAFALLAVVAAVILEVAVVVLSN